MSSRIALYLERLSLDDLLFLEDEIERRKNRFRGDHVVMAIHTEQRLMTSLRRDTLERLVNDLRRYYNECAAAGSGAVLAYSPESTLILFREVGGAAKTAGRLLSGLADLNGKLNTGDNRISLKIGLSCGVDVLAVGSMRSVRQAAIVKRAGQCAWKAPAGSMLIDENAKQRWVPHKDPVRVPIDIDGMAVYRVSPSGGDPVAQSESETQLLAFLKGIKKSGISTLKYSLLREDAGDMSDAWARQNASAVITLEAFDPEKMKNVSFALKCSLSEYAVQVERVRRLVSDLGLGLVKHEDASRISAG